MIGSWRTSFRIGDITSNTITMQLVKLGNLVVCTSNEPIILPNIDWNQHNTEYITTVGEEIPDGFKPSNANIQNIGPFSCFITPSIPIPVATTDSYITWDYCGICFNQTGSQMQIYNWNYGVQDSKWVKPPFSDSFSFNMYTVYFHWVTGGALTYVGEMPARN